MKNKKELNYKKVYYYLFNQVTDTIKALQIIQRKSENICTDESNLNDIEIDINETMQNIINNIKEKNNNIKE